MDFAKVNYNGNKSAMTIVTKKGDTGKTMLASGEITSKADKRVDTYGTIDELVSFLGLARSLIKNEDIAGHVKKIQCNLFLLGTELAKGTKFAEPSDCCKCEREHKSKGITEEHLKYIENLVSEFEPHLKLTGFVIPGDTFESAVVDVARSVARRLERKIVGLTESGEFKNDIALKYINRLADLLYVFARHL